MQLLIQCLLRTAAWTRAKSNCPFIDHHGKSKSRVPFHFSYKTQRGLVSERIAEAVPVYDYSIDTAADHVIDLMSNLDGIMGVVAHVDMPWIAPPRHEVSVNSRGRTWIKQRMNVHLANVGRTHVAVAGI